MALKLRDVAATLDTADLEEPLPGAIAPLLYRCAQEALRNVFTHSRARSVVVRVAGVVRGVCAAVPVGGVARVAGAVCANDWDALNHNAHRITVSITALLKDMFLADTCIKRPPPLLGVMAWAGCLRRVGASLPAGSGKI